MTGVEILTSYEVAISYAFNWLVFWICFGISLVFIIGLCINSYKHYKDSLGELFLMFVMLMLLGSTFSGLCGRITENPVEYETQYQITISDDVLMSEFTGKYEVIKQDGKIYTVRERE